MARDAVADIRERTDIVELIQGYVPLKKAGRSFKGLCPFHQEKTPSFIVFPDSRNFHCFGCGKGGDVFTFFQQIEGVEFREALNELARRAGVEISAATPAPTPEADAHRRRLIDLNDLAASFFRHVLAATDAGAPGREIAQQRGVSDYMAERFRLGFAPDRWDGLLRYLTARNVDPALAAEAGLLQTRDTGGYYDRFRGRLMFPIHDRDGQIVGFGGRALGDGQPKYLNSPQSAIFDKSRLLYGLHLAKPAIRDAEEVVIVEGYMDVIAAHQFGYANVVATMGTALTESQVQLVKRLADRIILALDADAAGQLAMVRGLETMRGALDQEAVPVPDASGVLRFEQKLKTEIRIATLPEGKDPDDLLRRDREMWPTVVREARPFLEYLIDAHARDIDRSDARAKSTVVRTLVPFLRQVSDTIVQRHYVSHLAGRLALDERVILMEMRRPIAGNPGAPRANHPRDLPNLERRVSTEVVLVAQFIRYRELLGEQLARFDLNLIQDARARSILDTLRDPELEHLNEEMIVIGLDDELADYAEDALAAVPARPDVLALQVRREVDESLHRLGRDRFGGLLGELQSGLRSATEAGDDEAASAFRDELQKLIQRHGEFAPRKSPYFRDSRDYRPGAAGAISR